MARYRSIVCPIHVGREVEIAAAEQSLRGAAEHGRVLCVGGDAGVGKTRLVGEIVAEAERSGFTILSGGCIEGGDAARGPISQALRKHLSSLGPAAIATILDSPARLALALVPEMAGRDQQLSVSGLGSGHIGIALWHLLDQMGRENPLLLVVEDVHWADVDTLHLLRDLARDILPLRALLLISYRTDELHRRHPLVPVLSELRRFQAHDEVILDALDREELRAFLSSIFRGEPIGDELLDAISERTGGNPFFTEELCRSLVERGDVVEEAQGWSRKDINEIAMPESVRETLAARLEKLPEATADLLRLAAIAGRDLNVAVIAAAASTDASAVEHAVAAGLDHQLLAERWEATGPRYAFRHDLTREVLAGDVIGPRRQHDHQRIAEALVAHHGDDLDAVAEQVAEHYARAGMPVEAGGFALLAAREAACCGALTSAARAYDQALLSSRADIPGRIDLLIEAAKVTWASTDRRASVAFAHEARELASQIADPVREARAMERLWSDRWWAGKSDEARQLVGQALDLVWGRDDATEALCIRHLTRFQLFAEPTAPDPDLIARGIEAARRSGDIVVEGDIHNTLGILSNDPDVKRAEFAEALRLVRQAGDRYSEVSALANGGSTMLWSSRLPEALEYLAEAIAVAQRHVPGSASYARATYAWAMALSGDLDPALELAVELAEHADVPSRMVALTVITEVALTRGKLADAREAARQNLALAEISGEPQRVMPAIAHLGRIELAERTERAVPLLRRALDIGSRPAINMAHWMFSPDLGRALAIAGDGEGLVRLVAEVEDWGNSLTNRAALAFIRGVEARFRNDQEATHGAATEAIKLYREAGHALREAEALLLSAAAALDASHLNASRADAEAAHRLASDLGSPTLAAEAQSILRRGGVVLPSRRRRQNGSPGGLSEREMEVARLVAQGMSNAEIAGRLFLSERTAGNHVSNILAKLELTRRAQVALWALAEGVAVEHE